MSTEEIELEDLEYFIKFKERLDIAMAYISDGRDITDEDYNVLYELYKIQRSGRLPFYKTVAISDVISSTQPDLFSADLSHT